MKHYSRNVLGLLAAAPIISPVSGFWRMTCGVIQTGRVDPIVSPGSVAGHAHKVSGASNFYFSETFDDLAASQCTSCEIQADKSIYWTPQLYYQHGNGTFQEVPNGGHVVYYLGRGDQRSSIEPFPPGFKMLSGDSGARANDTVTMTYNTNSVRGRLQSDRVSFACLDSSGPMAEQNYMWRTDCNQGMRAQIQFQSCWDGRDYQTDNSHVAYMSQIDNGVCPPTHPRLLPHLFFEVLYGVNDIVKTAGGRFVFANGDTTGFGFHGDFMNGWDATTLSDAVQQCVNNDDINGQISLCPPLAKSQTPYASTNCPERPALVNETVHGLLDKLPGCNDVTSGPARAPQGICATQPATNPRPTDSGAATLDPVVGTLLSASSSWAYAGCAADGTGQRTLSGYTFSSAKMTIDYCTSTCKAKGYPLAGVEYSKECYCAASLASGASYTNSSTCASTPKMVCAGNATQWCGAPSLLTVWNDTSFSAPQSGSGSAPGAANGTAVYNGCYAEVSGRLLNKDYYANGSVTVDQCVRYCQAGNYAFAGLEYAGECYCGNAAPPAAQKAAESTCNMPCKGNTAQMCGGSSRLSVYNNTLYAPTSSPATVAVGGRAAYKYAGCYSEGGSGRALGGSGTSASSSTSGDNMSVETCASFCAGAGFQYMGVEYGRECYCNNGGPINGAAPVTEGDCSMTCQGNVTEWCGGRSRINVYKSVALA